MKLEPRRNVITSLKILGERNMISVKIMVKDKDLPTIISIVVVQVFHFHLIGS